MLSLEALAKLVYGGDAGVGDITPEIPRPQDGAEVIEFAKERDLSMVDVKFIDMFGRWHHFSMPIRYVTEEMFEEGLGFDGSSIRAFQTINESDMILFPDPTTAVVDPALDVPTLSLTCNIYDPISVEPYTKDPRHVAQKAEAYLGETGIADTCYWGPEAEFFIFDGASFSYSQERSHVQLASSMGHWDEAQPYRADITSGYFRVPPVDKFQDWRSEAILRMATVGIDVEVHHGEVASAGQQEIDMRFDTLVRMADMVQWYKYILKNAAAAAGKVLTFMPKPMYEDNGSGMHTHQSLWKDGANLFYDADGYANLSDTAKHYIGGIIKHTPAILAFAAPSTNSYKRLVPGYEAPVMLAYSRRNRSAIIRIPAYSSTEAATRMEYRVPDPTANAYLAFSAMLMAGIDGIKNEIDPGDPMDVDLYEEEDGSIDMVPGSLDRVLDALEADHDFLLEGDVFTPDLLEAYIDYKRTEEVDGIRMRPHPYEFALYFDA